MAVVSKFLEHTWSRDAAARNSVLELRRPQSVDVGARPHRPQLYVVTGTGGLLPFDARAEQSATSVSGLTIDDRSHENVRNSAQQLEFVRNTARLSVTELARVFAVTRQTVHEWCQGAALAPLNARRLQKLSDSVALIIEAVGTVTAHDLRRPIGQGHSLLETVHSDEDALSAARALLEALGREAAQRRRLEARFSGRNTPAHHDGESGVPHLRED